jgi:hypothetical protein
MYWLIKLMSVLNPFTAEVAIMRLLGSAPLSHMCDQKRRSKLTGLSDLMTLFIDLQTDAKSIQCFQKHAKLIENRFSRSKVQLTRVWELLTRLWNAWHWESHCVFTAGGERVKVMVWPDLEHSERAVCILDFDFFSCQVRIDEVNPTYGVTQLGVLTRSAESFVIPNDFESPDPHIICLRSDTKTATIFGQEVLLLTTNTRRSDRSIGARLQVSIAVCNEFLVALVSVAKVVFRDGGAGPKLNPPPFSAGLGTVLGGVPRGTVDSKHD